MLEDHSSWLRLYINVCDDGMTYNYGGSQAPSSTTFNQELAVLHWYFDPIAVRVCTFNFINLFHSFPLRLYLDKPHLFEMSPATTGVRSSHSNRNLLPSSVGAEMFSPAQRASFVHMERRSKPHWTPPFGRHHRAMLPYLLHYSRLGYLARPYQTGQRLFRRRPLYRWLRLHLLP